MSYESRIKARIQANENRLKKIEEEIITLKAKHEEIYYQNEFLEEMIKEENKEK